MTIPQYIRHLLSSDKWFSKQTPFEINNGNCEEFAGALQERFPDGDVFWGDELPDEFEPDWHEPAFHSFFYYEHEDGRKLYYDAECPDGVTTPSLLPLYIRQKEGRMSMRAKVYA
jgi:hypothetical protein